MVLWACLAMVPGADAVGGGPQGGAHTGLRLDLRCRVEDWKDGKDRKDGRRPEAADAPVPVACDIRLTDRDSGWAIAGAEVFVRADMPSMPMAHPMRPVMAWAGREPGHYLVHLDLEMEGEWRVVLEVLKPTRVTVRRTVELLRSP